VESKALHADVNYRVVARPYFDTADVLFYAYYVHKKECRPVKMYSVKTGKMYNMIELCTTCCNSKIRAEGNRNTKKTPSSPFELYPLGVLYIVGKQLL
jgi:hypothetical protein